jgi:hypothetical protein
MICDIWRARSIPDRDFRRPPDSDVNGQIVSGEARPTARWRHWGWIVAGAVRECHYWACDGDGDPVAVVGATYRRGWSADGLDAEDAVQNGTVFFGRRVQPSATIPLPSADVRAVQTIRDGTWRPPLFSTPYPSTPFGGSRNRCRSHEEKRREERR